MKVARTTCSEAEPSSPQLGLSSHPASGAVGVILVFHRLPLGRADVIPGPTGASARVKQPEDNLNLRILLVV